MHVMLTAVECGSLSKASRKLGQPLATVSRKVSELEGLLKAGLLIRSSKGLELTPAGRTFVASARTILEQLDEAERAAAGEYIEPKGDLVVTAFLAAFPAVSVELMLTDRVAHFLDDHVDVALRIGDVPDSGLIAARLGAVRRVTCASPAYLLSRAPPAVPQDLAGHDIVSFDRFGSPTLIVEPRPKGSLPERVASSLGALDRAERRSSFRKDSHLARVFGNAALHLA